MNEEQVSGEPLTRCLAPSFLPATAVLEMTYLCNHACIFCSCPWFARGNGFDIRPELSIAQWKKIITKLCAMGVVSFAFTGGEPLLKKGIEELIAFSASCEVELIETVNGSLVSRKKPPDLHLLSNGKAMSEEVLALCSQYGVHLGMSLPGLTTFSTHTVKSEPHEVTHWFKMAKERGLSTHVGITVTKKNIHELYETIAESLLAGADSILLNRFLPGGRGLEYARELMLSSDEIVLMLDTAEEVLRTANRRGNVGTELPLCIIDESRYTHLKVGTQCSAALDFFAIDPSGYVRVCNHSPVRLNHMDDVEQVKDHPYWRQFVLKDYLPSACGGCRRLGRCDGGCREAAHVWNGSPEGLDPLFKVPADMPGKAG